MPFAYALGILYLTYQRDSCYIDGQRRLPNADVLSHKAIFTDDEQSRHMSMCGRGVICGTDGPYGAPSVVDNSDRDHQATRAKPRGSAATSARTAASPFTVKVGTIFEDSHIPMRQWLQAIAPAVRQQEGHLVKPAPPHVGHHSQVSMVHVAQDQRGDAQRLRWLPRWAATRKMVEADETFIGRKKDTPTARAYHPQARRADADRPHQWRGSQLPYRQGGCVCSRAHRSRERGTRDRRRTDEANYYTKLEDGYQHETVNHGQEEWARYEEGRRVIHTNTVEGYFALFKRGMKGIYQHC